ncbi:hypothetical protein [Pontibacter flavimaris]|uniref:Lipocalin-like domain-containing protein n=1 Tax=Pontibacter flavimaris TaxID=1797110 RepID=A0A1Q5PGG5_9BACT|nr:hypothetical protein [Pontibacter flavimaris]OKL41327.1 hypothetical protein A3841_09670 [Pontibacter flavimaris]
MLATLILFLTLTANPPPKFGPVSPAFQVQQADTVAMLSKTWALREQFYAHRGELEPVQPHEKAELTFRTNGTYTLTRHYGVQDAGSTEEGRWELDASSGAIRMQTRQVDGRSILSTMLPRWEVRELTDTKLVLRFMALSGQCLVLEAKSK